MWVAAAGPWAMVAAQVPAKPRASIEIPSLETVFEGTQSGTSATGWRSFAEDRWQAYLGIATTPVPEGHLGRDDMPDRGGLAVAAVFPRSPAEKAGLEVHDVVLEFDARPVTSPQELQQLVEAAGNGKRVNSASSARVSGTRSRW